LNHITGVLVKSFRGIYEGFVDNLEELTILIGRNGSGKSTVLEALYLVSSWIKRWDEIRSIDKLDYIVSRRGSRGSWSDTRMVLWHDFRIKDDIEIGIKTKDMELKFIINYNTGCIWLLLDKEEYLQYLPKSSSPVFYEEGKGLKVFNGRYLRFDENNFIVFSDSPSSSGMRTSITYQEFANALAKHEFPLSKLLDILSKTLLIDNYVLSRPELVERFTWSKILTQRLDKELVKIIQEAFEPDAEGLTYAPIGSTNALFLQLRNTSVRIDDLGDGARYALLALMTIYATDAKLVLIEEPETKMHPGGLKAFTEALLRVAKNLGLRLL